MTAPTAALLLVAAFLFGLCVLLAFDAVESGPVSVNAREDWLVGGLIVLAVVVVGAL